MSGVKNSDGDRIDIHAYLAEFDDIPGTRIYTAARARVAGSLS